MQKIKYMHAVPFTATDSAKPVFLLYLASMHCQRADIKGEKSLLSEVCGWHQKFCTNGLSNPRVNRLTMYQNSGC